MFIAAGAQVATAGCLYGSQTLPGSIAPRVFDVSRSFTSDGGQISISIESLNGPLRVRFPGYCDRWTHGTNITCSTLAGKGEGVAPEIENPNSYTVTYYFTCND
jgi:hypothetical protein